MEDLPDRGREGTFGAEGICATGPSISGLTSATLVPKRTNVPNVSCLSSQICLSYCSLSWNRASASLLFIAKRDHPIPLAGLIIPIISYGLEWRAAVPLFVGGEWIPRGRIVIASLAGTQARHPGQFHHAGKCRAGSPTCTLYTMCICIASLAK
jgi:hypothetical protein